LIKKIRAKTERNLLNTYNVRRVIRVLNNNSLNKADKLNKLNKIKSVEEVNMNNHMNDENYLISVAQQFEGLEVHNLIQPPILINHNETEHNTNNSTYNMTTTIIKAIPLTKDIMSGDANMEFAAKLKLGMNPYDGLRIKKKESLTFIKNQLVENQNNTISTPSSMTNKTNNIKSNSTHRKDSDVDLDELEDLYS